MKFANVIQVSFASIGSPHHDSVQLEHRHQNPTTGTKNRIKNYFSFIVLESDLTFDA